MTKRKNKNSTSPAGRRSLKKAGEPWGQIKIYAPKKDIAAARLKFNRTKLQDAGRQWIRQLSEDQD